MDGGKETLRASPTLQEAWAWRGRFGSAFGIRTEFQQNELVDIAVLGCREEASPLMVQYVSKLAVLIWKVLVLGDGLVFQEPAISLACYI